MSTRDDEREPLLPPPCHAFVRQRSIRMPRNRYPSGQPISPDSRPQKFHSGSLNRWTAHWGTDTALQDSYLASDRSLRQTDLFPTSARFLEQSAASPYPASDCQYLPPRPPPTRSSKEVPRCLSREALRPAISFIHESDGRAASMKAQAPSPEPFNDGARRYLESIRQTQQFSQSWSRNSYKDIGPTREGATPPPSDRFSRQTGSLRGTLSRYGHQGNESPSLRNPSPSPRGRTFVSDRVLESLKDSERQRSKSGSSSPQSPRSPPCSRRCRSVTREPESPVEERSQSFTLNLMQRLRRRSLSPSLRTLTPQSSPVLGRRSHKGSDATSEGAFKRHGSLPIPRKHSLERNWRSSSLRHPRAQTGVMQTLNNIISSRRESEACFALLPTPPSDTASPRSPLPNPASTLSNCTGRSSPYKASMSSAHPREAQDSSSSTGSSTDESPSSSSGLSGLRSSSSYEADPGSSFKVSIYHLQNFLTRSTSLRFPRAWTVEFKSNMKTLNNIISSKSTSEFSRPLL